ncbi:uncharacterized protein L199_006311 [Kwoniella botswanensis]|uniref:uncharacterized protein n=1 Tax=Kwoniella botswanensis TaxID=1268659 RepID=UPI00315D6E30
MFKLSIALITIFSSVCAGATWINRDATARPLYGETGLPNSTDITRRDSKTPWEITLYTLTWDMPVFLSSLITFEGDPNSVQEVDGLRLEDNGLPWWPEALLDSIKQTNNQQDIMTLPIEQLMLLFTGRPAKVYENSDFEILYGQDYKQNSQILEVNFAKEGKESQEVERIPVWDKDWSDGDGTINTIRIRNLNYELVKFNADTPNVKTYKMYTFDKYVTFPDEDFVQK